jgi:hypothetical protein
LLGDHSTTSRPSTVRRTLEAPCRSYGRVEINLPDLVSNTIDLAGDLPHVAEALDRGARTLLGRQAFGRERGAVQGQAPGAPRYPPRHD